ncbi:hypothetical protein C1H46_014129 [Malus baccata]|uniref:Uncharacterized protein n=1 Tax=Malus baccata TaxID=106549 RepID=A0A540MNC0_MALBA|nr:hypothetical protein C1H46_014129 [Malus baccata]
MQSNIQISVSSLDWIQTMPTESDLAPTTLVHSLALSTKPPKFNLINTNASYTNNITDQIKYKLYPLSLLNFDDAYIVLVQSIKGTDRKPTPHLTPYKFNFNCEAINPPKVYAQAPKQNIKYESSMNQNN